MRTKKRKVNRVVYINAELDAMMKRRRDINWSLIATDAFRRALRGRRSDADKLRQIRAILE